MKMRLSVTALLLPLSAASEYDKSNVASDAESKTKSSKKEHGESNPTPAIPTDVPDDTEVQVEVVDTEGTRAMLKKFVESLEDGDQIDRGYHSNPEDQITDYNVCTVVQQCRDPPFILSLGNMSPQSRGHAYNALSRIMSPESFNMLQLQQHSNLLLGEMQDWITACPGTCRELLDPNGLLEPIVEVSLEEQSVLVDSTDYHECGALRDDGRLTFWYCDESPRMVHEADIDVLTGKYKLGHIFKEHHIHARNSWHDYFSAYGDLNEGGGAFGMRFSGHHIDLNYQWDDNGKLVEYLPVFLGHNPLIVPSNHPPLLRGPTDRITRDQFYTPLLWANMAGVAQFSESIKIVLDTSNKLLDIALDSYVPLSQWHSTGAIGALLPEGYPSLEQYNYFDLATASDSDFNLFWALVEYTLRFNRGVKSTQAERTEYRRSGKVIWTTSTTPDESLPFTEEDLRSNMNFLMVFITTEDHVFFTMVNQLFTVNSELEPTNHLHSIHIPKALISNDHACLDDSSFLPGALCDPLAFTIDDEDDHESEELSECLETCYAADADT